MSLVVKTNTFSAGAIIYAAEHNENFDTIYADYNGNITNANVSLTAAIGESKIDFAGTGGHTHDGTDATKVNLAAPNAIGGTTPAAGSFTTLGSSGQASLNTVEVGGLGVIATKIVDDDTMADDSATQLCSQQSIKAYVDSKKNLSNTVWSFSLSATSCIGVLATTPTLYAFGWQVTGTSYVTCIATKFKKIIGISTISVYHYVEGNGGASDHPTVNVDINAGGVTGAIAKTTGIGAGPTWITTDLDVSGLSNGTVYDVLIQVKCAAGAGSEAIMYSTIGIAS